ncbi:MAG: rRNA maturation RNase YbeY [Defluviicoccus sp.]|nr:rRNA maturation RNase YbeY [Defluviicoccus sp.]MDE0277502.1 rRNA maturation RNase YbeY [Defluviicoccus sp.]
MNAETGIQIRCRSWTEALEDAPLLCRRAVDAACRVAAADMAGRSVEIGIALADDAETARLNGRYRGLGRPTDVLSFASGEAVGGGGRPEQPPAMLGDIVIAFETSARDAARAGKRLDHHLQHLVVHGLLHLLGYDHETERDANRMEALEVEILKRLGIADPYGDAVTAAL